MRLDARSLSVTLNGRTVLDAVDLSLGGGELVGIIGPNGAGKTTLLRALAGLVPSRGTVTHDGVDATEMPLPERARTIAFLAQGAAVHWPLAVEGVVALGRLPHRACSDAENTAAVERAMVAAGVAAFRGRTMDTLSGGERARVLLARALAVEAPILLADEPNAALDPYHQLAVLERLKAQARSGVAVAVVLHDLALAARFCTRLILLADNTKRADGPPADVLSDDNLRAAFRIAVLRGRTAAGEDYVLPWSRDDRGTGR
jgi:iron complex transport system ATP-binding protein